MHASFTLLPVRLDFKLQFLISILSQVPVNSIPFVLVVDPIVKFLITIFFPLLIKVDVPDDDIVTLLGLLLVDVNVIVS